MIIDCSECESFETEACNGCLVNAILSPPDEPLVIDEHDEEALKVLQEAGLAPVLKFRRKAG